MKNDQNILLQPNTWNPVVVFEYLAERLKRTATPNDIPTLIEIWNANHQHIDETVAIKLELLRSAYNDDTAIVYTNHWPNLFRLVDALIDGTYDETGFEVPATYLTATLMILGQYHNLESIMSEEVLRWILTQYQYNQMFFLPITEPQMQPLKFIFQAFFNPKYNKLFADFSKKEFHNFIRTPKRNQMEIEKWQTYITHINIIHVFVTDGYLPIHDSSPLLIPQEVNNGTA